MSIELLDEPATEAEPSTALTVQQRAVQALGSAKARAELTALAAKSVGITEVMNQAGREQAHGAGMALLRARTDIEKRGKAARDDATKFSKAVIAEEKALIALIEPEELRVLGLRDKWDEARAAEKAEAERIERERLTRIHLRIADIREGAALCAQCRTSGEMRELIAGMEAAKLDGFDEFVEEAESTRIKALERMRELLASKELDEAEAERVRIEQAAERQRLADERAALDRQREEQAAQARKEAQERAKAEAEAKAARDAEEARLKAIRDAEAAELQRQRDEVAARERALREQQEALDRQRAEAEAAELRKVAPPEPVSGPVETTDWPMPQAISTPAEPEHGDEEICDYAVRAVSEMFRMSLDDARERLIGIFGVFAKEAA